MREELIRKLLLRLEAMTVRVEYLDVLIQNLEK